MYRNKASDPVNQDIITAIAMSSDHERMIDGHGRAMEGCGTIEDEASPYKRPRKEVMDEDLSNSAVADPPGDQVAPTPLKIK